MTMTCPRKPISFHVAICIHSYLLEFFIIIFNLRQNGSTCEFTDMVWDIKVNIPDMMQLSVGYPNNV